MLQNDLFKQQFMIFNATISGQDRIYPNFHFCRTFLLCIYEGCPESFETVPIS